MIWLELRTNNTVYAPGWNFTESVWAPVHRKDGSSWPYWSLIRNVTQGDLVFHLRREGREKRFLGYSVAQTDGYRINGISTAGNHEWNFTQSFIRADLTDYRPFEVPVLLPDFFADNETALRNLLAQNRNGTDNRYLFYAVQRQRLQCLFGGYFTNFNAPLVTMLLRGIENGLGTLAAHLLANTGQGTREAGYRIGQQQFSDNVKRNYAYRCCYPGCPVENGFLIGGHIDRWSDNEDLRGHTGNGICLCLMHDKAFERGYFTLDENFRVRLLRHKIAPGTWIDLFLSPGANLEIKPRQINPLPAALRSHWQRIGHTPPPVSTDG